MDIVDSATRIALEAHGGNLRLHDGTKWTVATLKVVRLAEFFCGFFHGAKIPLVKATAWLHAVPMNTSWDLTAIEAGLQADGVAPDQIVTVIAMLNEFLPSGPITWEQLCDNVLNSPYPGVRAVATAAFYEMVQYLHNLPPGGDREQTAAAASYALDVFGIK